VGILTRGKVSNRLLEVMPPQRRTQEEFNAHFKAAGLDSLVEWNAKRELEVKIAELQDSLVEMFTADPPVAPADVLAAVKAKKSENNLPER
jgi:hypothetical protein